MNFIRKSISRAKSSRGDNKSFAEEMKAEERKMKSESKPINENNGRVDDILRARARTSIRKKDVGKINSQNFVREPVDWQ